MSVSRKDFEFIAHAIDILSAESGGDMIEKNELIDKLGYYFQRENSNFDAEKFNKACGGFWVCAGAKRI
jgi:hypothetical protein|tara:strand:- start:50 stop:256 length:207 start_codon:yes stop_codon:yes gene_type:complete